MTRTTLLIALLFLCPSLSRTQEAEDDQFSSATFAGLRFRSVGPALTSGRVADIAVHPENR